MAEDNDSISRRNVLAGLGTIGVGGALAGAGTSAFFSDKANLPDNQLTAGELALVVDWEEWYDMGDGFELIDVFPDPMGEGEQNFDPIKGGVCGAVDEAPLSSDWRTLRNYGEQDFRRPDSQDPEPLVYLNDVKPGDCWETTLSYHLCDNDGWVWFRTKNQRYEDADRDNKPSGHLADWAWARVWYDMADGSYEIPTFDEDGEIDGYERVEASPGDNEWLEGVEPLIAQGTLREVLNELNEGVLLDPDPLITPVDNNGGSSEQCVHIDDRLDEHPQDELRDHFDSGDPLVFEDSNDNKVKLTITGLHYQDGPDAPDSEVVGFDWESESGICQIDVKGGTPTKSNPYSCAFEGTAFSEFGAGSGSKRYGISWIEVSYCPDVEEEPTEPECIPASTTHYIGFEWCLPGVPGQKAINEIQGDRLSFDLQFYTEQCRHNDNPPMEWPTER
ncbi:SipW-dependent-type signal peptide-containing protein [Natrinema sp. HArc-T2]|uniref:SipW-dependent-type signal peptide-containing protein n=1 Tax=Natrinema sp. HArc-T2 TaxID=3242701 RepID=UPI00359D66EB